MNLLLIFQVPEVSPSLLLAISKQAPFFSPRAVPSLKFTAASLLSHPINASKMPAQITLGCAGTTHLERGREAALGM